MSDEDWESGFAKSIAVYLNGQGIPDLDERGQRVTDDSFVLCFNAHYEPIEFMLARRTNSVPRGYRSSTPRADPSADGEPKPDRRRRTVMVDGRSVVVLQATTL